MNRPVATVIAIGLVLSGLGFALVDKELPYAIFVVGAFSTASATIAYGIRRHRPAFSFSWACLAVTFGAGAAICAIDLATGFGLSKTKSPILASASLVPGIFAMLGILFLLVRRMPSISVAAGVDWLIAMIAVMLVRWSALMEQEGGSIQSLVQASDLVVVLSIVALLIRMASQKENRLPSLWLFLSAFPLLVISGIITAATGAPQPTDPNVASGAPLSQALFPTDFLAVVLLSSSAVHPSMAVLSRKLERHVRPTKISYRLLVFALALLVIPIAGVSEVSQYGRLSAVWIAGSTLLVLLVAVRMSIVLSVQRRVEAALAARVRQEAAVATLSRIAVSETDPRNLLHLATETVVSTLEIGLAVVFEPIARDRVRVAAHAGRPRTVALDAPPVEEFVIDTFEMVDRAMLDGQSVKHVPSRRWTKSADVGHGFSFPGFTDNELESAACVSISGRRGVAGVIGAFARPGFEFTPTEMGFLSSIADIIANAIMRQEAESELQQARKLESIGRLAAGLAHEINTPLQSMGSNLHFVREAFDGLRTTIEDEREAVNMQFSQEVVREIDNLLEEIAARHEVEYLATEAPQAIDEIGNGLTRVATIVKAMKAFGAEESEGFHAGDVNEAIRNTVTIANSDIEPVADVTLDLADLPPIMCRLQELGQVFLSVLVNAAQAVADVAADTGERGRIAVRTSSDDSNIYVEIADTGHGIPDEIKDKVFDPFFTTKGVGGAGQGLSAARKTILEHGGSITFESTNSGTTFQICLPLVQSES